MGLQIVGHNLAAEQQYTDLFELFKKQICFFKKKKKLNLETLVCTTSGSKQPNNASCSKKERSYLKHYFYPQ